MGSGWRIGKVFGIPLLVDRSWFFILALITYSYALDWQQEPWGTNWAWVAGFAMAMLLFGSVLLHELGHSLVARSQGITVNSITLFLFGGIAAIDQESKTPGQAFQVAIAGPAVSFCLFVGLSLMRWLPLPAPAIAVVDNLALTNFVLALFNMIPGLPLDGGQVLKATIWKATGSRLKGIRWAARAGQTLGWAAVIFGFAAYIRFFQFSFLWIALLGWFGIRNATSYLRITDLQQALMQITAAMAMTREFRVIDADMSLRQFADDFLLSEAQPVYYAASDGRYRGLVQVEDLREVERSLWETQTLSAITQPLTEIPSVAEATPLKTVIDRLEEGNLRRITVLSPAGAVTGVIDRGDIVRALAENMKFLISDEVIQRIKAEGVYPPGLQLAAIAKAAAE
ncbi:MAG: site-2 protease family protein [Oscillatoriophycideae cyanobacterium NC_groundwater_1537_Pr4_S-0.65um_50_18]|nr:site-2 protease family protein [Oscillatoriophycideae cyanobacterium NC_groundwater_1537_Pr4_S-0.65um_50_18]